MQKCLELATLVSFVALLLCGAAAASGTTPAAKGACDLITPADAQTAIGQPVGSSKYDNQSSPIGDGSSCEFRATTGSVFTAKSVRLDIHYSNTDLTGSGTGMAENLRSAGFKNVHTVVGVGTTAIWASNSVLGRPQDELTVIQGKSVLLTVLITGIKDEADALAQAKVLATRAISRL